MNAGEILNSCIGKIGAISAEERLAKIVDYLKNNPCNMVEVRDVVIETEKIFKDEFFRDEKWKNEFHCPTIYFYGLYRLLRDENMYLETAVGGNIVNDVLDKVLAVMAERLQEECAKHQIGEDYAHDVLTIALWIYAKVSRKHQGKANTLLRLCGEYLDKVKVLVMINCEAGRLDFVGSNLTYDSLEDAQNLLAAGLVIQLGAKKIVNQALEAEVVAANQI